MMLLTAANRAALPALGSQDGLGENAIAYVKFFDPAGSWTWYATEFDGDDTFYGLVDGFEKEWGYFSLAELKSVKTRFGLGIERDRGWKPRSVADGVIYPVVELKAAS